MNKVICIPILSLAVLLHLKLKRGSENCTVFYEIFPRYIRAMMRVFSISESKMITLITIGTGFEIKKIAHGDKLRDYNNIRMNVYIKIVDFCEKFIPEIKNDPWFPLLRKLIDNSASVATSTKYLAHHQMHLYLLSAMLCKHANNKKSDEKILFVGPSYWPKELYQIIKQDQDFCDIDYYQLPSFFKGLSKLSSICKIKVELITSIFKYGITFKKINRKAYKVTTELFDPEKLGGSPFDVDFFVDNKAITYADSLFYITARNKRLLKKNGYGAKKFYQISEKKNINIVNLENLSYNHKSVYELLIWYVKIFLNSFVLKGSVVSNLMPHILREHLNYLPLFLHFDSKHHIHFINSNGRAPLGLNSGVVTSLCRQHNVHSNGIQNRIIDARQYEFCFDSYDTYFLWGQAWIDVLGSGLDYVKNKVIIGVFNLSEKTFKEATLKQEFNNEEKKLLKSPETNVIIFPTDIDTNPSAFTGSFYSFSYVIHFLDVCMALAKKYPAINFLCKPKDESQVKLIKENKVFKKLNAQQYSNFHFIKRGRTNYMDLLLNADIAISIGFTSPGTDAILLNKKSIYYSQLRNAGRAFKGVPGFVSESKDDLISNFDNLIKAKSTSEDSSASIDILDPFRDGKAISRIINHLT